MRLNLIFIYSILIRHVIQPLGYRKPLLYALLWMSSTALFAQTTATVYTPNGTAVTCLVLSEFSASTIAALNAEAAFYFPSAQIIADASARYNCHAYAWYLGGGLECFSCPKYWMNSPGDDTYWNDCSYVEVFNASEAQKISYASDDHSAIRSSVAGKYDSKWGSWPAMRHDPTYTPYNSTNLKYYARLAVAGPHTVCTTNKTFTVPNNSSAVASVTWTHSSNLTYVSGQGTKSYTVKAVASPSTPFGWVKATITGSCGSKVLTKNVQVGKAAPSQFTWAEYEAEICPNSSFTYRVNVSAPSAVAQLAFSYAWEYPEPWFVFGSATSYVINFETPSGGYELLGDGGVQINVANECGNAIGVASRTLSPCSSFFGATSSSRGAFSYNAYPNPTTGSLVLEAEARIEEAGSSDTEAISTARVRPENSQPPAASAPASEFDFVLYSTTGNMVKRGASKQLRVNLDISTLPNGLYHLKIIHGSDVTERTIVIEN